MESYGKGTRYPSGCASALGGQSYQEDHARHLQLENIIHPEHPFQCTIVADGHKGGESAEGACALWPDMFQERMKDFGTAGDMPFALYNAGKTATVDTNNQIKLQGRGFPSGSTLCCVLIAGNEIYGINLGDSEAIIVDDTGKVTQLAKPMKASDPEKRTSIEKRGGVVEERSDKTLRLGRTLLQGGGLGNQNIVGLSARPKISSFTMEQRRRYAVAVYSDGISEFATTEHLGELIHHLTFKENKPPHEVARIGVEFTLTTAKKKPAVIP